MNSFFDFIEKYKYGIISALISYIGIFMYLQLTSVPDYFEIKAFNEGARIETPKEEEVVIDRDNIEVPSDFEGGNVTNTARDVNDQRDRSNKEWSSTMSDEEVEQKVREEERKMFEEAGGDLKRKAILEKAKEDSKKNTDKDKANSAKSNTSSSANAAEGTVMVEWNLKNRKPHLNDEWHIRNPGYKCGKGASGRVVVDIKVGQDGRVKSASCNESASSISSQCMLGQALKYAKMSRFNASRTSIQSGTISYVFVSQ
jgi:hypothetical protein